MYIADNMIMYKMIELVTDDIFVCSLEDVFSVM